MMRQYVQYRQAIFHSTPRRNLVAQHCFLAVIMRARIEEESSRASACGLTTQQGTGCCSSTTRLENRPTGKATRDFLNVFLCVTAINTQRMQLHQFASIVLIDSASLLYRWLTHNRVLHRISFATSLQVD